MTPNVYNWTQSAADCMGNSGNLVGGDNKSHAIYQGGQTAQGLLQQWAKPGSRQEPMQWMANDIPFAPPDSKVEAATTSLGFGSTAAECGPLAFAEHAFLWLTSPTGRGGERVFDSPIFFDLSTPDAKGRYNLIQNQPNVVPRFRVRGAKPPQVGTQEEQVSGSVLMAQPQHGGKYGSLVYYEIAVNDIYAYLVSAAALPAPGLIPRNQTDHFPTTNSDMDAISALEKKLKLTLPKVSGHTDEVALTVETKTSWVEADQTPRECKYITRTATIPTYDTKDPHKWVVNGQKTTSLALVGMHIAASAGGHPEMIWSTFENICNTPNGQYALLAAPASNAVQNALSTCLGAIPSCGIPYIVEDCPASCAGPPQTLSITSVPVSGNWLFAHNGSKGPFNRPRMHLSGTDIVAGGAGDIGPSDTQRVAAWGTVGGSNQTSPQGMQDSLLSTLIVAMNAAVYTSLAPGDIRAWYVMIGAIWTKDGKAPAGGNIAGAGSLANTTMETYQQGAGNNCFACHSGHPGQTPGTSMSHIFGSINSLFPAGDVIPTSSNGEHAAPSPGGSATPPGLSQLANSPLTNPGTAVTPNTPSLANAPVSAANLESSAVNAAVTNRTALPNPLPSHGVEAATAATAAGAVAAATLVSSQPNPNGGSTCTYQTGNTTFTREKKGACPPTSKVPAEAPAATAVGSAALVSSQPNPNGGSTCTYQLGNTTFTRDKKGACPPTSNPPKTAASASHSGASVKEEKESPTASSFVLVGSEHQGDKLVCTYSKGDKTVTHTTKKSTCPETPK